MEKKTNFVILLSATCLILILSLEILPFAGIREKSPLVKTPVVSHFNLSQLPETITLVLGGDVMLGRSVLTKADKLGDYSYPFKNVLKIFKVADLVLVNLEAPFYENCPRMDTGMIFCTDYKMVEGLSSSGVDVVNLANNHITNYGQSGIAQTQALLSGKGLSWTGMGQLVQEEVGGIKFGFLGFDLLTHRLTESDTQLIFSSKKLVDVLVVSVHWGVEYRSSPSESQRKWAKEIIGAGADVIVGHHPHWVQSMEYIDGRPVFYSLGNLVFDQMWSEETKNGELGILTFRDNELVKIEEKRIYIKEIGTPEITN